MGDLHPPTEGMALFIVNFIHPSRQKDTPGGHGQHLKASVHEEMDEKLDT